MSTTRVRPVWTPQDAAELRAAAEAFPAEVGQSVVLDIIVDCEHLS